MGCLVLFQNTTYDVISFNAGIVISIGITFLTELTCNSNHSTGDPIKFQKQPFYIGITAVLQLRAAGTEQ